MVLALLQEYEAYGVLLRDLGRRRLVSVPGRCGMSFIDDVLSHAIAVVSDGFAGRLGKFTPAQQVRLRADLTYEDLADELEQALLVGQPFLTSLLPERRCEPWEDSPMIAADLPFVLWREAIVHHDDIFGNRR
jgi:hypothetical protein